MYCSFLLYFVLVLGTAVFGGMFVATIIVGIDDPSLLRCCAEADRESPQAKMKLYMWRLQNLKTIAG
jgi:hypothetical protein